MLAHVPMFLLFLIPLLDYCSYYLFRSIWPLSLLWFDHYSFIFDLVLSWYSWVSCFLVFSFFALRYFALLIIGFLFFDLWSLFCFYHVPYPLFANSHYYFQCPFYLCLLMYASWYYLVSLLLIWLVYIIPI